MKSGAQHNSWGRGIHITVYEDGGPWSCAVYILCCPGSNNTKDESKGMKNIYYMSMKQRIAGIAILILNTIDLRQKA